jgi:hypothetical protein
MRRSRADEEKEGTKLFQAQCAHTPYRVMVWGITFTFLCKPQRMREK